MRIIYDTRIVGSYLSPNYDEDRTRTTTRSFNSFLVGLHQARTGFKSRSAKNGHSTSQNPIFSTFSAHGRLRNGSETAIRTTEKRLGARLGLLLYLWIGNQRVWEVSFGSGRASWRVSRARVVVPPQRPLWSQAVYPAGVYTRILLEG